MREFRRNWEAHFLSYEFALSIVVVVIAFAVERLLGGRNFLDVLDGSRQALYSAIASISGALLGFTVTGVSVLVGFTQSPRLRIVRESRHYPTVFTAFFSAIGFLALATVWSLASLILDRDLEPRVWVTFVALWTVVIAGLRLYRCVWILERIIHIATTRVTEPA